MEKNTIWAIVLSTVVLVVWMFIQTKFFPSEPQENNIVPIEKTEELPSAPASASITKDIAVNGEDEGAVESKYTIKTNKANITFTNCGGDIIGYELLGHDDIDTGKGVELADNISADNRSCAISFGDAENKIINDIFTAKRLDDMSIGFFKTFNLKDFNGGENTFTLIKKYTFIPDEYVFKLEITIDGATLLDFGGTAYTIRTSPQIGPHFDRKIDRYESRSFIAFDGEKSKKIILGDKTFKSFDKFNKPVIWAGIGGKYFMNIVVPEKPEIINKTWYSTNVEVNNYANAQAFFERSSITSPLATDVYYMYFGPRSEKEVRAYNVSDHNSWKLSGIKLSESLPTSGFLSWLENILKWLMEVIYKVVPNWGMSIIILTVILKLIMFPLTKKSAMGTLKMQELQPQMTVIQEKYKGDTQRLQQEMAKLYKEAGYNPMSGCLPMIFTFVVLFAMYNLFNNYFEFRGASFIKGWIPDLSRGDSIYHLKNSIPFLKWNDIRVLPVIYLISQLLFGKITGNGGTATGANAGQMKMMMYGMPIFFFFLFYNAPAGLLLYWTISNLIQMLQQLAVNKMMAMKKSEMIEKNNYIKKFSAKNNKRKR